MTRSRRSRVATPIATAVVVVIAAGLALTGCRPKTAAPAPQPPPNVTPDEYANMTELERRAKEMLREEKWTEGVPMQAAVDGAVEQAVKFAAGEFDKDDLGRGCEIAQAVKDAVDVLDFAMQARPEDVVA